MYVQCVLRLMVANSSHDWFVCYGRSTSSTDSVCLVHEYVGVKLTKDHVMPHAHAHVLVTMKTQHTTKLASKECILCLMLHAALCHMHVRNTAVNTSLQISISRELVALYKSGVMQEGSIPINVYP